MIGDILQPTHLLFILVIALLVLGPKRLPEVGRSLGRGMRDFRNALSGDDHHDEIEADASAPSVSTQDVVSEPDVVAQPAVVPAHDVEPQPAAGPESDATQEPAAAPAQRLA